VFGVFVAVIYIKLYGYFHPYAHDEDDFLQEMAQYQIFITLFIALLSQAGKLILTMPVGARLILIESLSMG
jgi:hypothetical protein